MAQHVSVAVVDDLDGAVAEETVEFGLDGVSYSIDLSDEHAAELRDVLAQYVAHGARTGGRKKRSAPHPPRAGAAPRSAPAMSSRERTQAVRAWAREQGFAVSDRGRISREIIEAYDAAQ